MDAPPCSFCGSTTHERSNFGGLTSIDWYCVDDAACQARRMETERIKAEERHEEQEKQDK